MRAYAILSAYDMDRGITSYAIFMPTANGIKTDNIDIHDDWSGEEDTQTDSEKLEILLRKKYRVNIKVKQLKPEYHVIW